MNGIWRTKRAVITLSMVITMIFTAGMFPIYNSYAAGTGTDASGTKPETGANADACMKQIKTYRESVADLPESINYVTDLKEMPDGSIKVIGGSISEKDIIAFTSKDGGRTWSDEERYMSKLPIEFNDKQTVEGYGYFSERGHIGIFVSVIDDVVNEDDAIEGNIENTNYNFIINPDGKITQVQPGIAEKDVGSSSIALYKSYFSGSASDGGINKVYFEDIQGNLFEGDINTGKITGKANSWEQVDLLNGKIFTDANGIYCVDDKAVAVKGTTGTGRAVAALNNFKKDMESQRYEGEFAAYMTFSDETAVYTADKKGVKKYTEHGCRILIDGADTELAKIPDNYQRWVRNLLVTKDGTIMVAVSDNNGSRIICYQHK